MSRDRERHVIELPPMAECVDCLWRDGERGALGRAAQHHDRTGHSVRTETGRAIYYGRGPGVPPMAPEQAAIPIELEEEQTSLC